ncbi:type II secretion system F family protein [Cellulomonas sp. NPDC058312]|uniref:type II secretion system F family protein n=1 Tax=Cellulomonas sp. NPDC058312 TaxID=3346441 RepID=UPI0036E3EA83
MIRAAPGLGGSVLVGVPVAAAVLLAGGTGAARTRVRAGPVRGPRGAAPRGRRVPRRDPGAVLAPAVATAAAELRAGRSPAGAWQVALGIPVPPDGVPLLDDAVAALVGPPRAGGARSARWAGVPDGGAALERQVAGVLAATRLAVVLGAPLAQVLDAAARTLAQDAEVEAGIRAALAGPRQTTRLLTGLPLVGVALGSVLGADVLGVLLDGGAGTAAGLLGLVLVVAGRRWVAVMTAAARRAGDAARAGHAQRGSG